MNIVVNVSFGLCMGYVIGEMFRTGMPVLGVVAIIAYLLHLLSIAR